MGLSNLHMLVTIANSMSSLLGSAFWFSSVDRQPSIREIRDVEPETNITMHEHERQREGDWITTSKFIEVVNGMQSSVNLGKHKLWIELSV